MGFQYQEERELPFTQQQLYDLVADVPKYPLFLPWCLAARVRSVDAFEQSADLIIGYKGLREKYTSRVLLTPPHQIEVSLEEGALKALKTLWTFTPMEERKTLVRFFLSFSFENRLKHHLMSLVFDEAAQRMMGAFERRAQILYAG